jgi:hypothetical protein
VDEPPGQYPVKVVAQSFPQDQSLARRSNMELVVRNVGSKTIPNATVTLGNTPQPGGPAGVKYGARRVGTFERRRIDRDLSDPTRPQFVLNRAPIDYLRQKTAPNGSVVQGEVRSDTGDDPTYVDTYSLGPLGPGKTVHFRWNVTAVEAGPYEIMWRIHAGQDGRAKAVLPNGAIPRGTFRGAVNREAPKSRVDFDDATTIDKR